MAKKSEINKKGRLAKSTLSVVLAASMVLTSSSFVWAAPVEDIAIISEEGDESVDTSNFKTEALEEVQTLESVEDEEELVGLGLKSVNIKDNKTEYEYTGSPIKPEITVSFDNDGTPVPVKWLSDTLDNDKDKLYIDDSSLNTTDFGRVEATIRFNPAFTGKTSIPSDFEAKAVYKIVLSASTAFSEADVTVDSATYTGSALQPTVSVTYPNTNIPVPEADYTVSYSNNTNASDKAVATVKFQKALSGRPDVSKEFTISPVDLTTANTKVTFKANQGFVYNGTEQYPEIASVTAVVRAGEAPITLTAADYKVEAAPITDDLKNAGPHTINIVGQGNFIGLAKSADYSIEQSTFNSNTVSITTKPVVYTGSPVDANVTVIDKVTGKDITGECEVKYYDDKTGVVSNVASTNIGPHNIKVNYTAVKGNFKQGGSIDSTYEIVKTQTLEMVAQNAKLTVNGVEMSKNEGVYSFSYNQKGQIPNGVNVTGVTSSANFDVEYPEAEDCINAGIYEVKLVGKNIFAGETATIQFKILPKEMTADGKTFSGITEEEISLGRTHSGVAAANATVVLTDGDKILEAGKDFTYTTDKTKKVVVITGIGNYTTIYSKGTTLERPYTPIGTLSLNDPSITVAISGEYNYTGTQVRPVATDIKVIENDTTPYELVNGTDYVVSYGENINAGEGTVIIQAKANNGRYSGKKVATFKIAGFSFTDTFAIAPIKDVDYKAGVSQKKVPSIVYKSTGAQAPSNVKYDVEYYRDGKKTTDFITPGTITIEVTGKNQYEGKLTASYTIIGTPLSSVAAISAIADQNYSGSAITPTVTLVSKTGSKLFTLDKDYKVSYKSNVEVGEAMVIVEGIGDYSGQMVATFNIKGIDISEATVAVDGTYTYTGKAITPKVTVKVGDTVIDPANYDVVATDNTNAGTGKFTVNGKNSCTGTTKETTFVIGKADQKLAVSKATAAALKIRNTNANSYTLKVTGAGTKLTYKSSNEKIATVNSAGKIAFKHVCGKATITVTAAADDNHNAATLDVAVAVKPATPKITITAKAKGFNAKATAIKDITGYQVGYSTDKNFAASKTTKKLVATTKALNKSFSGLSAKKGYYVRVRAYKKVGSTVYWGNWTSAKRITTK